MLEADECRRTVPGPALLPLTPESELTPGPAADERPLPPELLMKLAMVPPYVLARSRPDGMPVEESDEFGGMGGAAAPGTVGSEL